MLNDLGIGDIEFYTVLNDQGMFAKSSYTYINCVFALKGVRQHWL